MPTLATPPAAAPPEASGEQQHRAQALQLGAQISALEDLLQGQPSSGKELRALEHSLLHLATILKVPWAELWCLTSACAAEAWSPRALP